MSPQLNITMLEAYKHLKSFAQENRVSQKGLHILVRVEFIEHNGTTWELTALGRTIVNKKGWRVSRWNSVAVALFGPAIHTFD